MNVEKMHKISISQKLINTLNKNINIYSLNVAFTECDKFHYSGFED